MRGSLNIHPKVIGGTVSGSLGTLLVWLLGLAHVLVDPVVAGALVAALSAIGGWLAPILQAETAKIEGTPKATP